MYEITLAACLLRGGHALAPVLHAKAPIMDATSFSELGESCSALDGVDPSALNTSLGTLANTAQSSAVPGIIPTSLFTEPSAGSLYSDVTQTLDGEGQSDLDSFAIFFNNNVGQYVIKGAIPCQSTITIEGVTNPYTFTCSGGPGNFQTAVPQLCCSLLFVETIFPGGTSDASPSTTLLSIAYASVRSIAEQFGVSGLTSSSTTSSIGSAKTVTTVQSANDQNNMNGLADQFRINVNSFINSGGVLNQFVDFFNSRVDTYVVGGSVPCGSTITISGVDDPFVFTCVGGPDRLNVSVSSLCCAGLVVTTTFPDGQDTANTGFLDAGLQTLVNNAVANGLSGIVNEVDTSPDTEFANEVIHNQAAASQSGVNALSVFFNNKFFTYIRPASHVCGSSVTVTGQEGLGLLYKCNGTSADGFTVIPIPFLCCRISQLPFLPIVLTVRSPQADISSELLIETYDQFVEQATFFSDPPATALLTSAVNPPSRCPGPSDHTNISDLIAKAELSCDNDITFTGPISSTTLQVSTTYFHCGNGSIPEFANPELSSIIQAPKLCCSPPPPPPLGLPPPPPPPSLFSLLVVVDSTGGACRRLSLRRFLLACEPDEGAIFDSLQLTIDKFNNDTNLLMLDFIFTCGKPTGDKSSEEEVDGLGRYVAMRISELVEEGKVVCNSVITLIGAVDPSTMQFACQAKNSTMDTASFSVPSLCCAAEVTPALLITSTFACQAKNSTMDTASFSVPSLCCAAEVTPALRITSTFACQAKNSTMDTASFSVPSLCCAAEPTPALLITSTALSPDFTLSVTQVISATTVLINQVRQENVTLPDGTVTTPSLGFPAANDTSTGISAVMVVVTADTLQGRDALAGKFQDSVLSYILSAGISGGGHCGGTVELRNSEDEAPFVIYQCLRDPLITGFENITVRLFQLCCRVIEDTCDYETLLFYGCKNSPNQMNVKLAGNVTCRSNPEGWECDFHVINNPACVGSGCSLLPWSIMIFVDYNCKYQAQTMSQAAPDGDSSLRFGHWAAPSLCYEKFLLTGASTGTKVTTYLPAQGLCSNPTDAFRPAGKSYTYAAITDKLCDHRERQRLEVIILD
eukprot:gene10257-8176_t